MCTLLLSKSEKHFPVEDTEICHLEADDKYCDIFLTTKEKFTENHCLLFYENKLAPGGLFIKLGRSLLVNRKQIHSFSRSVLFMKNGIELQLNDALHSQLMELLG